MLRFRIIGSGSSGNCSLVSSGNTHILIDCGLPLKHIAAALQDTGLTPHDLSGVLISHEHTDHIGKLPTLLRRFRTPVLATVKTAGEIKTNGQPADFHYFKMGEPFAVGDLEICAFPISHDATEPSGFIIRHQGVQLAHVTDLGCMTELVRQRLRDSHAIVIESNHDEEMLKIGPYPWPLKQRVMSRIGHLSNRELAEFLSKDFDGIAREIILAHLSLKNNHPEIARLSAEDALSRRSFAHNTTSRIRTADPRKPTPLLVIE